nr:MAG TPA: hypothetical protein [Bacteriophage sp.]
MTGTQKEGPGSNPEALFSSQRSIKPTLPYFGRLVKNIETTGDGRLCTTVITWTAISNCIVKFFACEPFLFHDLPPVNNA